MSEEVSRPDEFRILIIGRANAGKTTILRAVCGAKGEPDVYDRDGYKITTRSVVRTTLRTIRARLSRAPDPVKGKSVISPTSLRGEHNIEYSLRFPSSPGFVFHDSRGFESGAVEELELVREFIQKQASLGSMKKQLHAIWYCFSTDNNRFMTAAEKEFFNTIDTGSVPVIAIFTKFDALDAAAFSTLMDQGVPLEEAQKQAPEHAQAQFNQDLLPLVEQLAHPPRAVVCLRNMNHKGSPSSVQKGASRLIESTEGALDDDALKMLLVQAQHVNVDFCIKAAVDSGAITRIAQSVLRENPRTFNPLQKGWIEALLVYFPNTWAGDNLAEGDYRDDYEHKYDERRRGRPLYYYKIYGEEYDDRDTGYFERIDKLADIFIDALAPLIPSIHSMPPPLQVLATGCAIVIIAAKALWLNSITKEPEIRASSEHYIQSQTPELVKIAIMGAFQGVAGHYNTPWSRMVLQLIVLNNQI